MFTASIKWYEEDPVTDMDDMLTRIGIDCITSPVQNVKYFQFISREELIKELDAVLQKTDSGKVIAVSVHIIPETQPVQR